MQFIYDAVKMQDLARLLLKLSYKEGDFTLASGRKSDYYFDCRVTSLSAWGSYLIGNLFYDHIVGNPEWSDVRGVGGMTMGADPLVTAVTATSWYRSEAMTLDGLLVRKQAKDHGTSQYVEGLANFRPGDKIVMLEDVITTGGSLITACDRVKAAGLQVVGTLVILDREEGGAAALLSAGYPVTSLFTRSSLKKWSTAEV